MCHFSIYPKQKPIASASLFSSKNKGFYTKLSQEEIYKRLKKYAELARKRCNEVSLGLHSYQFGHSVATHTLKITCLSFN